MRNLRGASYEKQAKDAFFLLLAYGESRRDTKKKGQTHSLGTAKKRKTELIKFVKFLNNQENFTCKMNLLITPMTMDQFFKERLLHLKSSSKETILRVWSAMSEGFKEKYIDVRISKRYFDRKVQELRGEGRPIRSAKKNQAIKDSASIIEKLYEHRYATGVYADVLVGLGIRASEAIELINHPENYITIHRNRYEVCHLVGKGNHQYGFKKISPALIQKIENVDHLPSYQTLYRDLKKLGITAHRFRYTYAKEQIDELFAMGLHIKEAYLKVSEELNHKRPEMTRYYLVRA